MDRYFEKYVELTQAENPVTWPDPLHRHEHAHKSPGMIVCFRVAPNSSPSPKSLPAPKKRLVLDLITVSEQRWKWEGRPAAYKSYDETVKCDITMKGSRWCCPIWGTFWTYFVVNTFDTFHSRKSIWKWRLENGVHFVSASIS